ncbi:hypothetical protein ACW2Q0_14815 [Nocardia sp. R16R-3T]
MSAVQVNCLMTAPDHGEPVVLSGSPGSDLRMWDPRLTASTTAGYRVLQYHHRGHSASPVPVALN